MLTTFIQKSIAAIHDVNDFDKAIQMARSLGELLWKNSTDCYELTELENALVEKFASLFTTDYQIKNRYPFLHVLTKAYETGGHTRIVERLIRSETLQASAVLITESTDPNALKKLSSAQYGCTKLEKQPDSRRKIQAMISELAKCQTVILHLHPHDIESVIAVAIAKKYFGIHVLLYNHADHVFSYGHGTADRILEISYFGWSLRAKRKSEKKSVFTGIPLDLPDRQNVQQPRVDGHYLAAAGSAYKFKPGQGFSFPCFVESLLGKVNIPFVLIGVLPWRNWWWWPIFAKEKGKPIPRVQFIPKMPHENYVKYLRNATAYIDSFPMTGGTAFPEILSLGVPCFGLLTGAHGYTPGDQVKSLSVSDLSKDLLSFLDTKHRSGINLDNIIDQVYEVHQTENVAKRVAQAISAEVKDMVPTWENPDVINPAFYEEIWQKQLFFSFPVHTLPNLRILLLFIEFWLGRNKLS